MARRIDLNADLGESEAPEDIARDIAIMDIVTSANIACGGHAGNDATMKVMLEAAAERGVAAGAHPSYPDRANFGRVSMDIGEEDLFKSLIGQMEMLKDLAEQRAVPVCHVKPHGALYNDMVENPDLMQTIARASRKVFPNATLVGLAAKDMELSFIREAFIDRLYTPEGRLVPRSEAGAVVESNEERIAQALMLTEKGKAIASNGEEIQIDATTLCLHSDSDGALETARLVRRALEGAGIEVTAPA